jgi:hypothetical protein
MAADSTAVRAGRAFVEIFADDSALARGLKSASRKLKAWGAGLTAAGTKAALIGTAMISPFVAATKAFSDAGGQLVDMSQRTGVSVEALGGLKYAAEQSGASLEDLEGGIKNMQVAMHDAASGADSARKKFAALGLSIKDLKNLPPDQAFLKIAEAISKIQNPSRQAALSLELLGKRGLMLLPLMRAGAAGIKVMVDEAARLGIVMSTEDAIAAEAFGDATAKALTQIKVAFIRLGAAVLPILEPVISKFSDALKVIAEWINKNRGLVVLAVSVAAALLALSYAITAVGFSLTIAGSILGGVVAAFGFLGTALASVAALATPFGITLVAILAALAGMVNWSRLAADSMFWLGSTLGPLKDEVVATMSAIGNAIAGGKIQAAVRVLWAFLNLQWQKGTGALLKYWIDMTEPIATAWNDAIYGMADIAVDAFFNIQSAFGAVADWILKIAAAAAFEFSKYWISAIHAIGMAAIFMRAMWDDSVDVAGESIKLAMKMAEMWKATAAKKVSSQEETDKNSKARKDAIEVARRAAKSAIENARKDANDATKSGREKSLKDAEEELKKARDEWKNAVDGANPSTSGLEKLEKAGPGIMGKLGDASGGAVSGTFNSFGVRGLSTGGGTQAIVSQLVQINSQVHAVASAYSNAPVLSPTG